MAVEYQAVQQKVELTMNCHNCHLKYTFNPEVKEEVLSIAAWLKVQTSNGATYAYCGVPCLQKGAHNLKPPSGLELVGD